MKRQALGRGLSALLSEEYREAPDQIAEIDLDTLTPNHRQPRAEFDEAALIELAQSIESNGILQPILVRRDGRRLEIVAGERRWRAAKKLGWKKIPCIIRELPEQQALEAALVENLQRENLNAIEEAKAFDWLIQDFGLSQDEVAKRVGKDRSTVANQLRLLRLPDDVQARIVSGQLSMGHARALLGLGTAEQIKAAAERILKDGLSVRKVEEMVRDKGAAPAADDVRPARKAKDVHDRAAERRLTRSLGTRVSIRRTRRGGRIELAFFSEEELQRIFDLLVGVES